MKIRKRLYNNEATHLKLEIKNHDKERKQARYQITKEQWNEIQNLRNLTSQTTKRTSDLDNSKLKETPFDLSAWSLDGKIMSIDEFCQTHDLPRNDVKNYRLCTHTRIPTYNITFNEQTIFKDDFDYLGELKKQLNGYKSKKKTKLDHNDKNGVITMTDFHFGAYISAMRRTPEFNISILCDMFENASDKVNRFNYKVVHIHILGDLIESFTGLNHKNSWKGLDKGMFGISAIKLFVELFDKHFLSRVNNIGLLKLVAGNHDRTSSDNKEDVDGGAAEAICWGLDLIGYDIEFSTSIITHKVDNVCYILNHGHHPYTKSKTTEELCWDYGIKGCFNFIMEGHLHSRIKKLNAKQLKNFTLVSDDTIDCRRQVCPSLFTGNSYSEYGGWSTTAGYTISEENDSKKGVDVFDFSL